MPEAVAQPHLMQRLTVRGQIGVSDQDLTECEVSGRLGRHTRSFCGGAALFGMCGSGSNLPSWNLTVANNVFGVHDTCASAGRRGSRRLIDWQRFAGARC